MDANTREKVVDALIKHFEKSAEKRYPWVTEDQDSEDIVNEVKYFFEDIESRLSRLEHPTRS